MLEFVSGAQQAQCKDYLWLFLINLGFSDSGSPVGRGPGRPEASLLPILDSLLIQD